MTVSSHRKLALCFIAGVLASSALLAQAGSVNVPNWTVPPYRVSASEGGLTTMTDNSPGVAYVGMQPCRVFDTRDPVGPYGGPRLIANTTRNFDIDSGPCGPIPGLVQAYSMNFGAILADGDGFITIWPAGAPQPVVSQMNTLAGKVIANSAVVPAGAAGAISIFPNTGVHMYGDINGYFTQQSNSGTGLQYFAWQSDNGGTFGAAIIQNTNATTDDTWGLVVRANSTGDGSAAVLGTSLGAGGYTFGGKFVTSSTGFDSAGVKGVSGYGDPLGDSSDCSPCHTAGVRGVDNNATGGLGFGVLGLSKGTAVSGVLLNTANTFSTDAEGRLGTRSGATKYGVLSLGGSLATGIKSFADPHPTDPGKVIKYITLEGPESGIYFRGRARFQNGTATIDVPEDFRLVSDPDGLSIQVTPIGEMATVAVAHIGLDRIVVRGSRNVEFFYLVNGVRKTFKQFQPIADEQIFAPESAESRMPGYLSEAQKTLLIQNGTYRPDGTVNMETAHRLGWDRAWEAQKRPQPRPEPAPTP
jgi:hypothetical protein